MTLSSASQLGKALGKLSKQQQDTQQNLSPEDPAAVYPLFFRDTQVTSGTLVVKNRELEADAFILDHPVNGELDSTYYKLDTGYTGVKTTITTINI